MEVPYRILRNKKRLGLTSLTLLEVKMDNVVKLFSDL